MAFTARPTSYDEVQYSDNPYPQSHPGQLAVVAILAGLTPAPVGRCRVLEIGCARGGNLIPMAVGLPGSSFVGIDASAAQVEAGRSVIEALDLTNIDIAHRSILDVDAAIGRFDYIIAHGTYSWVPAAVRERILEIMAGQLSPRGVAYLSYNTHPGWRLRGLVRDLMSYHAGRFEQPADRAREARLVLEFLAASAPRVDRTYAAILGQESERIRQRTDAYLLHEYFDEDNEPVYFHEMARRASAKGLRFVGEPQGGLIDIDSLFPDVAAGLRQLARDEIEFEQYLDFLIGRSFRQSVFCHEERTPGGPPRPGDLAGLDVGAPATGTVPRVAFRDERLLLAALSRLAEARPATVPWPELVRSACGRIGTGPGSTAEQALTSDLIRCYRLKAIEFRPRDWTFATRIGEKPLVSPLARYQAGLGDTVTNLRHESLRLDEFSRAVLRLLDGTRDRAAVLQQLRGSAQPGSAEIGATLDQCLGRLAGSALLMGGPLHDGA